MYGNAIVLCLDEHEQCVGGNDALGDEDPESNDEEATENHK